MNMTAFRLGVDFGTSHTVAALLGPDGRVRPLLFDGSPLLVSAVYAGPAGTGLLTGVDALRAAVGDPAGLEPHPKRRIDDGTVWLGGRELRVVDLIAAVLSRVASEAQRVAGPDVPIEAVLTYPATWGTTRRGLLIDAADRAGFTDVRLVAEPVAAAASFNASAGRDLVVYDLGAGTFDVSVVRRSPGGFEVVASGGLLDVGGLDFDAAVVAHVRAQTSDVADAWRRLDRPETPADQHARHALWQAARALKEQLSRHSTGELYLPLVDRQIHVTREEFTAAAQPYLDRTVVYTKRLLAEAGVSAVELFLVGGSSRIPLAASLLHRALGVAPTICDHPELVVAEGALHAVPPSAPPLSVLPPSVPPPEPAQPSPGSKAVWPRLLVATGLVLAVVVTLAIVRPWQRPPATTTGNQPTPTGPASAARSARVGSLALVGHSGFVYGAAFSRDGVLATASGDRTVRLWDVAKRQPLGDPLSGHTDLVNAVAFNPGGTILASAGADGTVRLWDVPRREPLGTPLSHVNSRVMALAFSPDGRTLATVATGRDTKAGALLLWDVNTRRSLGDSLTAYPVGSSPLYAVAFSPDGRTLATGDNDNQLRLWDVASRRPLGEPLTGHTNPVYGVAFNHDGTIAATASADHTVRLWDVPGRRPLGAALTGHTGLVNAVAFNNDGSVLASASDDGTVRLWDVARRMPLNAPLAGHSGAVNTVAFNGEGTALASAGDDGTARLWDNAGR
jgi:WD40 repeat protein/actin-like ATPase involved in cell morphogenesis